MFFISIRQSDLVSYTLLLILCQSVSLYCLCAFARDPKLREESKMYIDIDQDICNRTAEQRALEDNQVSDNSFSH